MKWTVFLQVHPDVVQKTQLYRRTHGETSFIEGIDEHTPLITKETKQDEAWDRIKRKFPNINPANSSFTATLDEYDRVEVRLKKRKENIIYYLIQMVK